MYTISKKHLLVAAVVAVVLGSRAGAYALGRGNSNAHQHNGNGHGNQHSSQGTIPRESQARIDQAVAASAVSNEKQTVNDRLLYLIEEEKLAHDVYQQMYDLYGAQTFKNIMASETTHQNRVLEILQAKDIADPRLEAIGVFQNKDLQALYDKLVAQGSQSLGDAYKVGVTIEEVDIADLEADLKLVDATDTDTIAMMQALKRASGNHLRAFSRHV